MKEELKQITLINLKKEVDKTMEYFGVMLKHKQELAKTQKTVHEIQTLSLEKTKLSLEIQLSNAQLEVAQRSQETESLRAQFAANTERFRNVEEDNKRLEENVTNLKQQTVTLNEEIDNESKRLAILKQSKEDKLQKITELKSRLQMIQRRKEDYFPRLEKSLLNQYLEYKGNIRVFVRVRPLLSQDFKAYSGTAESFDQLQKSIQSLNSSQISIESAPEKSGPMSGPVT